jgi:polar amino acid transport system substrate-binding protein
MNATTRVLAALAVLACLAGCAAPQRAQRADRLAPVILPDGYSESPTHSPPPAGDCGGDPGRSLSPAGLSRGADGRSKGPALERVRHPDHGLVVGLSQTAERFSRRDLVTGELTGFEIEIVRRIAQELFGDPNDPRLRLVTMPTGSRLYALDTDKNKQARAERHELREIQTVDLVIADVSVTCSRVETYGLRFSTPYLATDSGLMVRQGMEMNVSGPDDLGGRRVCSGTRTTNIDDAIDLADARLRNGKPPLVPVAVTDTSECLMLLQRGQVDAIYTDVLILEGFRRQDPGTVLLDYRAHRYVEAAIAMSDKDDDLVRFVNCVLDRMRADGSLQASYENWFGAVPGLLPLPAVRYSD